MYASPRPRQPTPSQAGLHAALTFPLARLSPSPPPPKVEISDFLLFQFQLKENSSKQVAGVREGQGGEAMSWPTVSMATMASTTMTPPPSRAPPRNESDPEDDDDFKEPKRMLTRKKVKRAVPRSMVKREWPQLGRPVMRRREEPLDEGGREEAMAEVKENLCPICGKNLNEVSPTVLGRQAHINACLDKNPQKDEEGCSGRVDRTESGGLASMATRTTTRPASRPRPRPRGSLRHHQLPRGTYRNSRLTWCGARRGLLLSIAFRESRARSWQSAGPRVGSCRTFTRTTTWG